MNKASNLNMPLPEPIARGIRNLVDAGEFASTAEYVRFLIRADLPRRLHTIEQDRIIYERLEASKQGGPFVGQANVEGYMSARLRGEKPDFPETIEA